MLLSIFTKNFLLLLFHFIIIFFHENYFYFFMFRDVPERVVFRVLSTPFKFSQIAQVIYNPKIPDRFATQYVCTNLRGLFLYFIFRCQVPLSSFLFYLVRRYDVFLCNDGSKNSIEDCLNLTCFQICNAIHWKRDVSKEPFTFILETSYR